MAYTPAELFRIQDQARREAQATRRAAIDLFWVRVWARVWAWAKWALQPTRQRKA